MGGSLTKRLKSQKNFMGMTGLFLSGLALNGCASFSASTPQFENDAPRNLSDSAQKNWEKNPAISSPDYHFFLAQAYSSEGKVERAIEEYRAALVYDPGSALLHSKLAGEYFKRGSVSFAIEECKAAIKLDSKNADVHLLLGGIYSLNNEYEKALVEYEAVLRLDPHNDEAAVFKTQVLAEKDQMDEALKFIRGFTSREPDSAAAWYYLAKLEYAKNHINEAIQAYRKALEVRPGFVQGTLALGLIFETHSETKKAIELYESQMEEKEDTQVASRLVTLYLKGNQIDRALKLLSTMAVLDPEDLNTQLRIGLLHMQKEEWESARRVFEEILDKVPDSDKVHYYLAATYEQEGKWEESVAHLLKVSIDSKLFEDANVHAAEIYRKLAMEEKAYDTLKAAIAQSPENTGFYLMMASMQEDEKKWSDAASTLRKGLDVFPNHTKMRYFYGAILEKLGKPDEAVEQMEIILGRTPNDADALNFIAYTWTTQGIRLKDAEEMLRKALKLKPNNPFILDSMGWNQFMLGHSQAALKFLEKAAGLKSDEEAILVHLAEAYMKNQMPQRAEETRARILKLQSVTSRSPASEASK